jgi:3-oxoacyl-(acyl-carrier-protein) synthase
MSASGATSRVPDEDAIVLTGLGILTAAGDGIPATIRALQESRSGLGALARFESPRCGHYPVAEVAGPLPGGADGRTIALGRAALLQALEDAGLDAARRGAGGLAVGMTVGGMPESEDAVADVLSEANVNGAIWLRHECGFVTRYMARDAGLDGPALTLCTACSSGAEAIAGAAELLRSGAADFMVAGGVDALCRLTLNGFASLLAMDPQGCRPFDVARAGMSLGEGAAFVVLERFRDARARGARLHGRLAGAGNSCDAHHVTAPDPDGRGAEAALRKALAEAALRPEEVDYVNAHGTGTPDNDRAEGKALRRLFGEDVPPVSSTKRVFGHTLGAAGAVEAIVSVLAIEHGFLPGTSGLEEPDPDCEVIPLKETIPASPRVVVSNSFGFGGNNTVLCFVAA